MSGALAVMNEILFQLMMTLTACHIMYLLLVECHASAITSTLPDVALASPYKWASFNGRLMIIMQSICHLVEGIW